MNNTEIQQFAWGTVTALLIILFLILTGMFLYHPRQAAQVAGPYAPPDLRWGPVPTGGVSASPTGGGAGGSGAGGFAATRVGGIEPQPVVPSQLPGRMAPVNSSGSGLGDHGNPIPPDVPLITPPVPAPPAKNAIPGTITVYGATVPR